MAEGEPELSLSHLQDGELMPLTSAGRADVISSSCHSQILHSVFSRDLAKHSKAECLTNRLCAQCFLGLARTGAKGEANSRW